MRRKQLEINPDLYELYEKTTQLKIKIKKQSDEKVWKCLQSLEKHLGFNG
jgi:hypothetical protein